MLISGVSNIMRKVIPVRPCGAVIVAAGSSSRMGGIDKVMAPICGEPIIVHTVRQFQQCDLICEIIIVTREDLCPDIIRLCGGFSKLKTVVIGGSTRQESVSAGIAKLSPAVKLVAIHDAARPLVSNDLIDRTVRAAHSYRAAAPAIAVKDTIKVVQGGLVFETPDRATLFAVQTPQVFDKDLLKGALKKVDTDCIAVTDDCSAVEYLGMKVKIVEGDERNLKITSPMDLKIAQLLMEE